MNEKECKLLERMLLQTESSLKSHISECIKGRDYESGSGFDEAVEGIKNVGLILSYIEDEEGVLDEGRKYKLLEDKFLEKAFKWFADEELGHDFLEYFNDGTDDYKSLVCQLKQLQTK